MSTSRSSSGERAENITNPDENIYDCLEFLHTNGVKPHVMFKLNFAQEVYGIARTFRSARLSMEEWQGPRGQGAGACQVKLCSYYDRTNKATAGFQYEVLKMRTLRDFVEVVKGMHRELEARGLPGSNRSDLTKFAFVDIESLWDGCRDWVAQSFYRFNALGWVGWSVIGIVGAGEERLLANQMRGTAQINWDRVAFHDIIGKQYGRGPEGDKNVYYSVLLLERGTFHSSRFVRSYTDHANRFSLPYRPLPAQVQAGAAGRGGSGSGRGAGSSGQGSGYGAGSGYGQGSGYGRGGAGSSGGAAQYSSGRGSGGSSAQGGGSGGSSGYGRSSSGQASSSNRSNNPPRGAEYASSSGQSATSARRPKEPASSSGGRTSTLSKAMRGLGISGSSSSSSSSKPSTARHGESQQQLGTQRRFLHHAE
ncbi:hypothetical protein GE09DRAFT_1224867 [Coniochaeta sp. 2T2.1]|nr:hypothetical protein GE09DRAFT_1224867 [Coniochaeta sp. 2T2.1]